MSIFPSSLVSMIKKNRRVTKAELKLFLGIEKPLENLI